MSRRTSLRRAPRLVGGLVALLACCGPAAYGDEPTAPRTEPLRPIQFSRGDPNEVVVQGEIKLHRREVTAFLHLLRTAFEAPIPKPLEDGLRKHARADFRARGVLGRQAWLKLVDPWPQVDADLRAGRTDAARAGLQAFRLAIDKRLRAFPDARVHQLVTRLLKRRSEVLLVGPPEVSGLAADVYVDVLVFVASLGRNEAVRVTDGQRSVLQDHIRNHFKMKGKHDHTAVRDIAAAWNAVQRTWTQAPAADQIRTRALAVQLLGKLPPEGRRVAVDAATLSAATVTTFAQRVRQAQPKLDALAGLSVNPTHVWKVLKQGLKLESTAAAGK